MRSRGKHHGHRRPQHSGTYLSSGTKNDSVSLPADSPVLAMFKAAALKLNERQDRHERLVKLSRDITIESKRIIFLLHSAITKESAETATQEANERLKKLVDVQIRAVGLELENCPAYLHSRAVTAGFQEFIEAKTLCSLMDKKLIVTHTEVQKELQYKILDENHAENGRVVVTLLPQLDYFLGLADLTGELMRKAINSISSGESEECFFACQTVRDLYTGFLGLFGGGKDLARKLSTTRNNVSKVELAVYALKVRGGEAPPTLLLPPPVPQADWDSCTNHSDDEGYY